MSERRLLNLFCTAARGTEALLKDELTELGAKKVRQDRGAVRFVGSLETALRVCVHSRLAMRLLLPFGEADAVGPEGLYDAARAFPWEEHLTPTTTFAVEASIKDSEHRHSGFVALKIKDAIVDRLREKKGSRPDVDTSDPVFRIVAHLKKTTLSISLDVCGESLNRRGYRVSQTEAPLKETLASAILRASGYTGEEPLCDVMCGSGTIAIEAALLAMRRAPGMRQRLAIERWPAWRATAPKALQELRAAARSMERPLPFPVLGRDRDPEAVKAAQENAQAARLPGGVTFEVADALTTPAPSGPPGLIATNPPYGDRLNPGGQKGMKSFYFALGESLARWNGWRMAILCGNEAFESAFHRKPRGRLELWNGPIECALYQYAPRSPADAA